MGGTGLCDFKIVPWLPTRVLCSRVLMCFMICPLESTFREVKTQVPCVCVFAPTSPVPVPWGHAQSTQVG